MKIGSLPARIAWRYLRAPKSHSAVSAISIISVVGVAIATAAIVCVLSVFNGFKGLLSDTLDLLAPDVLVTPATGKTFADADSLINIIGKIDGVGTAMPTVTDNALAIYNAKEMPITLRGVVPDIYSEITEIDSLFVNGEGIAGYSPDDAAVSVGVAQQLGTGAGTEGLFLFAPRREGRVNLSNPMASFLTDSVSVGGIFQSLQSEYDENTVICDISTARELFQYTTEATAIEIDTDPDANISDVAAEISRTLGEKAIVKDRFQQQETHFRMVNIEKWMTFLLLIFILLIASFNIISTLCMLIIEKQSSMATMSALGMNRRQIGKTFWWESIYVSLAGGIGGIILGVALCLIQEKFGLIKLGGDPDILVIQAYPVIVEWSDLFVALIPVAVIGIITAWISAAFARSRITVAET